MVRLRRNRWYSADGQSRVRASVAVQASGTRRVISLCFLLGLVIVLMQKASDPKHVRNAFSALGVPFERTVVASTDGLKDGTTQEENGGAGQVAGLKTSDAERVDGKWMQTCEDLVPRILSELSPAQLLELSQRWFAVELVAEAETEDLRRAREQAATQLESIAEQLSTLPEGGADESEGSWLEPFNRFRGQWDEMWSSIESGTTIGGLDPKFVSVVNAHLDSKLALLTRDAAPWSPKETVPFLRLLQRGQVRSAAALQPDPPLLSTLQLEAELSVYRGKAIRFRGEVRRAEYVSRESNAFGISGYWSLWMRGEDGAAQPIAVYTTHSIGKQLANALEQEEFPAVEVMGIVGKRLAYASQGGVEVAPTIFATSLIQFAQEAPPIPTVPSQELASKLAWAGLLALLASGAVLAPILATRRTQSRHRKSGKSIGSNIGKHGAAGSVLFLASILSVPGIAQSESDASDAQQASSDAPPWAQSGEQDSIREMLTERITSAFERSELDELRLYLAGDTGQIPDAFLKSMQRLQQLGWARARSVPLQFELPAVGLQVKTTELRGQVRLAMPVRLSEQQQLWFQKEAGDSLFRLEVVGDDGELQAVLCENVPSQWMQSAQLKQPVVIEGLSLCEAGDDARMLCLFAKRPQWLLDPASTTEEWLPQLEPRLEQLGELGWDLANVDLVRAANQKAIQSEESQAYFSLMKLLAKQPEFSSEKATAMQALAKPTELVGAPVQWSVRLVSGSEVEVASAENAKLLGTDRYYQFDGFVDIGDQIVHYKMSNGNDGPEVVDFEQEFPITIVMLSDSPYVYDGGEGGNVKSWEIGKYVTVSGVFYRLWSYQSELMEKKSTSARQAAPLVIASSMTASAPRIRPAQASVGWFGYALCLATLAILGGILFTVFRPEPRIRRR